MKMARPSNFVDYQWFRATLGKCEGQAGYNPVADYDGVRCVGYSDYGFGISTTRHMAVDSARNRREQT